MGVSIPAAEWVAVSWSAGIVESPRRCRFRFFAGTRRPSSRHSRAGGRGRRRPRRGAAPVAPVEDESGVRPRRHPALGGIQSRRPSPPLRRDRTARAAPVRIVAPPSWRLLRRAGSVVRTLEEERCRGLRRRCRCSNPRTPTDTRRTAARFETSGPPVGKTGVPCRVRAIGRRPREDSNLRHPV